MFAHILTYSTEVAGRFKFTLMVLNAPRVMFEDGIKCGESLEIIDYTNISDMMIFARI